MKKVDKKLKNEHSKEEKHFLKLLGLKISEDLAKKFETPRPIEWLSWETGIARSALREVMAGRSNPKILTLRSISKAFGYKSVVDFLKEIEK
jgi:transcriptional regulator with XRE-family HTH domain